MSYSWTDDKGRTLLDSIPGLLGLHYTYNDSGFLTQTRQGDRITSFDYNALGRLETITDPLNRSTTMEYDAVGRVTRQTYAGGLYDSQTKLVRFGARDYDASVGRWTAKDPIGFDAGQSNLYNYCKNCPICFKDPTGLVDLYLGNHNEASAVDMMYYDSGPIYSVGSHGNPGWVYKYNESRNEYEPISPADLAKEIRADKKNYKEGMPVMLLACRTGKNVDGKKSYAELLAEELNATVYGPSDKINIVRNSADVVEVIIQNNGHWESYPKN